MPLRKGISQPNFHSSNVDNALHLNKIEARSLRLEHERLQGNFRYHVRSGIREAKVIEHDLRDLPDTTGCIGDRIFRESKFQALLVPVKREPLIPKEPALGEIQIFEGSILGGLKKVLLNSRSVQSAYFV